MASPHQTNVKAPPRMRIPPSNEGPKDFDEQSFAGLQMTQEIWLTWLAWHNEWGAWPNRGLILGHVDQFRLTHSFVRASSTATV
jgi:hypothetical protein